MLAVWSAPCLSSIVMLAERIASIVPEMPADIRRWFVEQDFAKPSTEHQDWDLILADWKYVPLLIEYAGDPANPLEKRFEAFSALMVLQGHREEAEALRQRHLSQDIRRIV